MMVFNGHRYSINILWLSLNKTAQIGDTGPDSNVKKMEDWAHGWDDANLETDSVFGESYLREIKGGPSTARERMLHTGAPQEMGKDKHAPGPKPLVHPHHVPGFSLARLKESKPFDSGPKGRSGYDKNGLLWKRSVKEDETNEAFGTTKVCRNCHHPVSEHDKAGDCEHDYCTCTELKEADQMTPRNERAKEDKLMEAPGDKKYGDYPASEKFAVACQECGKKFKATGSYPKCPKCGSHDIDLAEQREFAVRLVEAEHWSDFQKWKNEKSGEVVSAAELNNRGANLGSTRFMAY